MLDLSKTEQSLLMSLNMGERINSCDYRLKLLTLSGLAFLVVPLPPGEGEAQKPGCQKS